MYFIKKKERKKENKNKKTNSIMQRRKKKEERVTHAPLFTEVSHDDSSDQSMLLPLLKFYKMEALECQGRTKSINQSIHQSLSDFELKRS